MNETNSPRKLVRSRDDRFIGGVAAGIANYFNLDPVLIRVAFVISIAFGGIGVLAYLALLVMVPVDGDPAEPVERTTGIKRVLVIGGTIVLGCLALASIDGAGFGGWFFGIGPGPLFGILIWLLAIAGVVWLVREATRGDRATTGAFGRSPDSTSKATPAAPAASAPSTSDVTATMAPSPSQTAPTEAMPLNPPSPATPPPAAPSGNSAGAQVGRIMMWVAIGVSALIVFSFLAVVAAWSTAEFGAIPMASLVVVLSGGLIFAAVRGRSQLAVWMLATALVIAVPMAAVSLADLRIEGGYGEIKEEPIVAGDIPEDGFKMAAGAMTIDLRRYPFQAGEALALPVNSGMGMTRVIVPDEVCVSGRIEGKAGLAELRGVESSGVGIDRELRNSYGDGPELNLEADFKLGYFEVIDASTWRDFDRFDRWEDGPPDEYDWEHNDDPAAEAAARTRGEAACLVETQNPKPASKQPAEKNRST